MIDMHDFFWARAMSRGFLFQFVVPWFLLCRCSLSLAFSGRLYTRTLCYPLDESRVARGWNGWSLVLSLTLEEQVHFPGGLLFQCFVVIGDERCQQRFLLI